MKFEYIAKDKITDTDILDNLSDFAEGIFWIVFSDAPYWIEAHKKPELSFYVPDGHTGFNTTDYAQAVERLKIFITENNTDVEDWLVEKCFDFIPSYIQAILAEFKEMDYAKCKEISDKLNQDLWQVDFDLSSSLFDLRPMNEKEIEAYKERQRTLSYISDEMFKVSNSSSFSIQVRNYEGASTKWLNLDADLIEKLIELITK